MIPLVANSPHDNLCLNVCHDKCTEISDANKLKIDVNTESLNSLNTNKSFNEIDIIDNDNDSTSEVGDFFTTEYHIPVPKCTKN